jgi:hypothetical protein
MPIFVETCPDMFLVNCLSLSLHYDLVIVEGELEWVKWGVLSTWWRSQEARRAYLARWCTWVRVINLKEGAYLPKRGGDP